MRTVQNKRKLNIIDSWVDVTLRISSSQWSNVNELARGGKRLNRFLSWKLSSGFETLRVSIWLVSGFRIILMVIFLLFCIENEVQVSGDHNPSSIKIRDGDQIGLTMINSDWEREAIVVRVPDGNDWSLNLWERYIVKTNYFEAVVTRETNDNWPVLRLDDLRIQVSFYHAFW